MRSIFQLAFASHPSTSVNLPPVSFTISSIDTKETRLFSDKGVVPAKDPFDIPDGIDLNDESQLDDLIQYVSV